MNEKLQLRFWSKVLKGPGCWRWLASKNGGGYGRIKVKGRLLMAHRVSYELAFGPIPEGYQVDHVRSRGCLFPDCVNPAHLEAVTPGENTRRSGAWEWQRSKTHCPQGHPYLGANLYVNPNSGKRACQACHRVNSASGQRRRRRRAASAERASVSDRVMHGRQETG